MGTRRPSNAYSIVQRNHIPFAKRKSGVSPYPNPYYILEGAPTKKIQLLHDLYMESHFTCPPKLHHQAPGLPSAHPNMSPTFFIFFFPFFSIRVFSTLSHYTLSSSFSYIQRHRQAASIPFVPVAWSPPSLVPIAPPTSRALSSTCSL